MLAAGVTPEAAAGVWFMVGVVILAAWGITKLVKRIEDGCPQCSHCLAAKRERERLAEERARDLERRYGFRDPDEDKKDRLP